MTASPAKPRMQPLVAARALRRLIKDPERTEHVFEIIRAMSGDSVQRGTRRFARLPAGQRILRDGEELLTNLLDRTALAAHPAHSLAAAYLDFTAREQITADGLVDASADDATEADLLDDPAVALYARRLRDQHDLWHTVTDYGRDTLGEACLLGFTYAQTRNRGIGIICLVGTLNLAQYYGRSIFGAVWRGYRDGRRAAWLPGQDWAALLPQGLDAVREQLGLVAPARYQQVRDSATFAAA